MMTLFSVHSSTTRRCFSVGQLVRSQFGPGTGDTPACQDVEVCVGRALGAYLPCYPMKKCRSHTSISQAADNNLEPDDHGYVVTSAPENAFCVFDTEGDSDESCQKGGSGSTCGCQAVSATRLQHSTTSSTSMSCQSGACSPPRNERLPSKTDSVPDSAFTSAAAAMAAEQRSSLPPTFDFTTSHSQLQSDQRQQHQHTQQHPSGEQQLPLERSGSGLMGAFGILLDQLSAMRAEAAAAEAAEMPQVDLVERKPGQPPPPPQQQQRQHGGSNVRAEVWTSGSARGAEATAAAAASFPSAAAPAADRVGATKSGNGGGGVALARLSQLYYPHQPCQQPQQQQPEPASHGLSRASDPLPTEGPQSSRFAPGNCACHGQGRGHGAAAHTTAANGSCANAAAAAPAAPACNSDSTGGTGSGSGDDQPSASGDGSASSLTSLWAGLNGTSSAVYDSTDDNVLAGQRPARLPSLATAPRVPVVQPAQVAPVAVPAAAAAERGSCRAGNSDSSILGELAPQSVSCYPGSHFIQARNHMLQFGYFSHDPVQSNSGGGGGGAGLVLEPEMMALPAVVPARNSIDVGYYHSVPARHRAFQAVQPPPQQQQQQFEPRPLSPQSPHPYYQSPPQPHQQPHQHQSPPSMEVRGVSSAYPPVQQGQGQHDHHRSNLQQYQQQTYDQRANHHHLNPNVHPPSPSQQPQPQGQVQGQHSTQYHQSLDSPSRSRRTGGALGTMPTTTATTLPYESAHKSHTSYGYRRARSSLAALEQPYRPRGSCGCECDSSSSDDGTEEATRRIAAALRTHTGMTGASGWGLLGADTAPTTPTCEGSAGRRDPWATPLGGGGGGGGMLGSGPGGLGLGLGLGGEGGVDSGGAGAKSASCAEEGDDVAGPLTRKRSSYHLTNSHAAVELFLRLNHARQTMDFVKRQTLLFAGLDKAELTVWEGLDLLNELREYEAVLMSEGGEAQEVASLSLLDHAFQTAELCRLHHPDLDWLHLVGLMHGLGKLLAHRKFGSQPQWAICGETFPLGCRFSPHILGAQYFTANPDRRRRLYNTPTGVYGPGCGLLEVVMSWSAPEYLYLVVMLNRTSLPQDAVWVLRHAKFLTLTRPHSCYMPLCSPDDLRRLPLLRSFQQLAAYRRVSLPEGFALGPEERTAYYSGLIAKYMGEGRLRW